MAKSRERVNDAQKLNFSKNKTFSNFVFFFAILLGSFFVFGSGARASSASDYWKTYFSDTELKAVQKNAERYTLAQIKNKSDSWKSIFTGANIKNGSISSADISSINAGKIKNLNDVIDQRISGSSTPQTPQDFSADRLIGSYAALDGSLITNLNPANMSSGIFNWASGQTFPAGKLTGALPALDGSQITGISASQVGAIPYSGATSNVDLGSKTLTTTGTGTFGNIKTPIISPSVDSTSAFQINKADGTTNILNVDTTSGRVGIGTTSPSNTLSVVGSSYFDGNIGLGAASKTLPSIYIDKNGGQGAGILFNNSSNAGQNPAIAVQTAGVGVRAILDNQGTFYSNANFIMSGTFAATADTDGAINVSNYGISVPAALGPTTFALINSDQADALVLKPFVSTDPARLIQGLDKNDHYIFNITGETGQINWGAGTTLASMDTGLSRTAAGTLAIGNATNGDSTGTLLVGNVGIGTTTPAAALDVNGEVKMKIESSQPFACDATHDGTTALTSGYRTCVCKGGSTTWVFTIDGTTTCTW